MTTIEISTIKPLLHAEAMRLQSDELSLTLALLHALGEVEWSTATECPDWDVRAMYLHVLGACEAGASMRENVHQMRRARAHRKQYGGPLEAALSSVQVRERCGLSSAELVERLSVTAPKTVRGRSRTPALMRKHAGFTVDGPVHEAWKLGYLIDTIYLRDLWMHRVDLSRALNRALELSAAHDGRIVANVVAEWARRHGQPFVLDLHGPAGGVYEHDADSPGAKQLSLDAIEFCRTLSGRESATGLLTTVVPF
jgi:uncharacterized protein (TIGR03083 family)